jgi:DNA repair protein RadC
VDDLTKINGVGRSTATAFAIIRSVNSLYLGEKMEGGEVFDSLEKVAEMWRSRLTSLKFEVVEIALLDSSLRLMKDGIRRLETGTACATAFYPRKIVESVIRSNATAVIIAHNHPGGSAVPSVNDERSTKIIQNALQSIDARLVDHLIIAQDSTFSFRENGLL